MFFKLEEGGLAVMDIQLRGRQGKDLSEGQRVKEDSHYYLLWG